MKKIRIFIMLMIIISSITVISQAEYKREHDIYSERFFITARSGFFIGNDVYDLRSDFYIMNSQAWLSTTLKMDNSFVFGGSIGYFFTENLGIRVDVDLFSTDFIAEFTAEVPNLDIPGLNSEVSATIDELTGNWTAVNLDLIYRTKLSNSIVFTIGAGVTAWFTNVYVIENFTWEWADFTLYLLGVDFDVYTLNAYSFNVLGSIELYIDDDIGIIIEGKYLEASADLEIPEYLSSDPLDVSIGGIYLSAGLNLHF